MTAEGVPTPAQRQGPRPVRGAGRAAADGGQRPHLGVRLRAADADPGQGPHPHPALAVVVRAARGPGAAPRRLHRRAGRVRRPRGALPPAGDDPVECVARGYLTGSGLAEYLATGVVCGVPLPAGLVDGSELPEPIFTPATKAELGEHDENVTYDDVVATVGADVAASCATSPSRSTPGRATSRRARHPARRHQARAGPRRHRRLVLGDEVLTPDSSRFWPADQW